MSASVYNRLVFGGTISAKAYAELSRLIDEAQPPDGSLDEGEISEDGSDDSFEGITEYCRQHGIPYDHYQSDDVDFRGTWRFRPGMDPNDRGTWINEVVGGGGILITLDQFDDLLADVDLLQADFEAKIGHALIERHRAIPASLPELELPDT